MKHARDLLTKAAFNVALAVKNMLGDLTTEVGTDLSDQADPIIRYIEAHPDADPAELVEKAKTTLRKTSLRAKRDLQQIDGKVTLRKGTARNLAEPVIPSIPLPELPVPSAPPPEPEDLQDSAFNDVLYGAYFQTWNTELEKKEGYEASVKTTLRMSKKASLRGKDLDPAAAYAQIPELHQQSLQALCEIPPAPLPPRRGWVLYSPHRPLKTTEPVPAPRIVYEIEVHHLTPAQIDDLTSRGVAQTCQNSGFPFQVKVEHNDKGIEVMRATVNLDDIKPIGQDTPEQHIERFLQMMTSLAMPVLVRYMTVTAFGTVGTQLGDLARYTIYLLAKYYETCGLPFKEIKIEGPIHENSEEYQKSHAFMQRFKQQYPADCPTLNKVREEAAIINPTRCGMEVASAPGVGTLRGFPRAR